MTFNNSLQTTTEPAFLSHEKYVRQKPRGFQKRLTDCCYSFSNLALIVACVIAFIFSVKFLNDDPLYEYGEYLLTLKFYRYIIFILVILPLTLLVPLANAVSAFFVTGSRRMELGSTVLSVKIFYQIVMLILIFVGLVFIAPSIRHSNVANQLELEFRRHMKWRYDSEFSYEFLDKIQAEYECCDELWYRSNYFDKLPLSCYHPDGTYSRMYLKSCPETLGSMVSNRCIVIAISLVIIILTIALLIGIDAVELLGVATSSRHYDIRERETSLMKVEQTDSGALETTSLSSRRNSRDELDRNDERDELVEELTNRLKMRERQRETPLISSTNRSPTRRSSTSDDDDDDEVNNEDVSEIIKNQKPSEAILTRAKYHLYNNRPKSPVFVRTPDSGSLNESGLGPPSSSSYLQPATQNSNPGGTSPKSVLKKTSSFQTIDSDSECENDGRDFGPKRDAQTRRSLLNVRFAE